MNFRKFLIENPLGVIILAILSGLITNLLSSFPPLIYPFLAKSVIVQVWTIILLILLGVCIALLFCSFLLKQKINNDQEAYQLLEIDKELLDCISELAKGKKPSKDFDILIQNLLHNICDFPQFNNCGISIFCPEPKNKNYLITWKYCFAEAQDFTKFYIGNKTSSEKIGIAGKVYKEQVTKIVHFQVDKNNKIEPDDKDYEIFPGQRTIQYRSMMCIPIIDTNKNSLGVLCITSRKRETFDCKKSQNLGILIANRLAAILLVSLNVPSVQPPSVKTVLP